MNKGEQPVTRLGYCQYLLVSQINYTLTNFADHTEKFSHDVINRYLAGEKITPHLVWEVVLSTQRTDQVVTNDFAQDNTQAVQEVCGLCWKIEQFHRETNYIFSR